MAAGASALDRLARGVEDGRFSLDELIEHYVSMIYAAEGQHYGRAASRLGKDWRTLRQRVNADLVDAYSVR